jgi:hypothetical protein
MKKSEIDELVQVLESAGYEVHGISEADAGMNAESERQRIFLTVSKEPKN